MVNKRTKAEIELAKKKARKGLTKEQLAIRKFCLACNTYKVRQVFPGGTGEHGTCRRCAKMLAKKRSLRDRLLAKEIYVPGANKIVVDKMIAGRGLVSRASLASFLGVHERTVTRLRDKGEITSYDFLGQVYFKKEEIEAWLHEKLGEKIELDNKYIS